MEPIRVSRVNDLLLMSFQSSDVDAKLPTISHYEYESFFTAIGFTLADFEEFSPLHHEIIRVEQSADDNEPIQVYEQLWPELMLGQMVFSRGGVSVLGGRYHIVKEVAERSTLYFSFRRANRKTSDLSVGWGTIHSGELVSDETTKSETFTFTMSMATTTQSSRKLLPGRRRAYVGRTH